MNELHQIEVIYQGRTFPVLTSASIEGKVVVTSVQPTDPDSHIWYTAELPPSVEDLKNLLEKGVRTTESFNFMFSDERDKVAAISGEEAVAKYDVAMEALEKLREAHRQYTQSMKDLGATLEEQGSYEDLHHWYAIEGIPIEFSAGYY